MIRHSQHGFRRGRSCLTNLLLQEVTHLADKGKAVAAVYLVCSKAFDTISYGILLEKLSVCGLHRHTLL